MSVTLTTSGGVAHDTGTVVAKVAPSASCRLATSLNPDLSFPTYTGPVTADSDGFVRFNLTGLSPSQTYHYGVEDTGGLDPWRGKFTTLPTPTVAASFTIAHATCTSYYDVNPSNHRVYDSIATRAPLAFYMLGDLDYSDVSTDNPAGMRAGLTGSLSTARASAMVANVPLAYVWDDHDFGPDNSNGTFVGKASRASVYRQMFGHHTLADAGAVYQAWTVGRVRFIMTDNRYYRSANGDTDGPAKTMLGATQKAWLKAELLAARGNPLTVWLNSQIWCVDTFTGIDADGDHWGGFATERAEIANYCATNGITNVTQLTGDMHALGIRQNADYSTAQTAPMRVYSAAALDALPITRAGGWDTVAAERGQYGTLTVTDDGTNMDVLWQGWRTNPTTGVESLIMSDSFTVGPPPGTGGGGMAVKVWDGTRWVRRPVRDGAGVARPVRFA